jgi:hypothetical protein
MMARTHGWVWGFVFAAFAGLALAADKRFALPAGDSLVIQWNTAWTETSPPAGPPVGTVAFNGPGAALRTVRIERR